MDGPRARQPRQIAAGFKDADQKKKKLGYIHTYHKTTAVDSATQRKQNQSMILLATREGDVTYGR